MNKKSIIVVFLLLMCIQSSCSAKELQISSIKYIFYTEGVELKNIPINQKVAQGEELNQWYTTNYYVDPNVFDLIVNLKNNNTIPIKQSRLHVEFWLSESPIIMTKEPYQILDVEQMQKRAKQYKYWEKDIQLKNFKPNELRQIKIERIKILEIVKNRYNKKLLQVMGWNCKVICGNSKMEKPFEISFPID